MCSLTGASLLQKSFACFFWRTTSLAIFISLIAKFFLLLSGSCSTNIDVLINYSAQFFLTLSFFEVVIAICSLVYLCRFLVVLFSFRTEVVPNFDQLSLKQDEELLFIEFNE